MACSWINFGLMFYMSIFQGCIYPWNIFAHIFNCSGFLKVVNNPHFVLFMREISIRMLSFTSPTFDQWSWSFAWRFCHLWLTLSCVDLLIYIRIAPKRRRRFETFHPLFHCFLLLILPRLMECFSTFTLLIQILSLPYVLFQSLWLIKLDFLLLNDGSPLKNLCIFTFSSLIKPTYLNNSKNILAYSSIVIFLSLSSTNSCIFLS